MQTRAFQAIVIGSLLAVSAVSVYGQAPDTAATAQAVIGEYCVACHNDNLRTSNLTLQNVDFSQVGENAEMWERVVRKLRAGVMPPPGARRPTFEDHETTTAWLEGQLDTYAAANPNVGAVGVHRLNRVEYANAIRELLDIEVDVSTLLPSDDSAFGFDNIAGALSLSPALLEAYVSAAGQISRIAVGDWDSTVEKVYIPPSDTSQDYHVEGLPLGTRGGLLVRQTFPADGEYEFYIEGLNNGTTIPGEQLELSIDGDRVELFDWDANRVVSLVGDRLEVHIRFRTTVKAGTHDVGVAFLATNTRPNLDLNEHFERSTLDNYTVDGFSFYPQVGYLQITGPYNATGASEIASREKIFVCEPQSAAEETACAEEILSNLTARAYRRPSTDEHMETLMTFYQSGRENGDFDDGIEMAIRRLLVDPNFLFRVVEDREDVEPGEAYRISDLELASRLSFFLWSNVPDEELLTLAAEERLSDPEVLEQQVMRMIRDPRSEALVDNFAAQWLYLRNLNSKAPDQVLFPDWDDTLRRSFDTETRMLFESVIREDRNVVDLLTADYTFLNERLARHYGIPNVTGSQFRRVTLGEEYDAYRGLLGKGSILTLSSLPGRTSPVERGKWVLANILGTAPPNPPPNVPPLEDTSNSADGRVLSLRETMEMHRANTVCAACHRLMDPIGFSMENFDAVALWRDAEGPGVPINPVVELFDGSPLDGPGSLRDALLKYSPQFVRVVTEKLMTYGLGRGVEYYDMPVVRSIVRQAAEDDYRFSSIVLGIVKSDPFMMNTKVAVEISELE